jgi:hypothetical protein
MKKWNGLCLAGKHGLDFQGQPCDMCPMLINCQAIVEDYENGTRNNLRRVTITPKDRPCMRSATVQLGHLCLCAQHGKLAAEGLVDEGGHVAPRGDLRAVRDNPRHFPGGLHSWARGQKLVPLASDPKSRRFHVGQHVQFNGVDAKVIAASSKGDWVQLVHYRRRDGATVATTLSKAEARKMVTTR